MKILNVTKAEAPGELVVRTMMREEEFRSLMGHLDDLIVLAPKTITEPSSITRTGAKHNRAKWLLVPKNVRRQFKCEDFDCDRILCGLSAASTVLCIAFILPKRLTPLTDGGCAAVVR